MTTSYRILYIILHNMLQLLKFDKPEKNK